MVEANTKGILKALEGLRTDMVEQIGKVDSKLEKRFDELESKLREFDETQRRRFKDFDSKLDRQDRRIAAIESFPIPTTRPGTYHAGTEVNSVSRPVRRKQSHYG